MIELRAEKIRLIFLDVDGILTDGCIVINDQGEESKCFHVRDGLGLKLLMGSGIDVVIITGRQSDLVEYRLRELGIREIHQGVRDKGGLAKRLIEEKALGKAQVCCMGDDLPDIPMFRETGLPITVPEAPLEVRKAASHVTKAGGGRGAVREICELILKSQNRWQGAVKTFTR
jgi:YrbI family 3-deoxy-D-manno-octulosonate 8-phosphate phosphatase